MLHLPTLSLGLLAQRLQQRLLPCPSNKTSSGNSVIFGIERLSCFLGPSCQPPNAGHAPFLDVLGPLDNTARVMEEQWPHYS